MEQHLKHLDERVGHLAAALEGASARVKQIEQTIEELQDSVG